MVFTVSHHFDFLFLTPKTMQQKNKLMRSGHIEKAAALASQLPPPNFWPTSVVAKQLDASGYHLV